MEIVWNDNKNTIPFEIVDIGHTFLSRNNVYLKIEPITRKDGINRNAIDIENGKNMTFYDDEYVVPVVGKFVVG